MIIFDIETRANKEALEFLPEPQAPSNYKDETKIKAYVEEKRVEQVDKAALDPDYGEIIAIGMTFLDTAHDEDGVNTEYLAGDNLLTHYDYSETEMISHFWKRYKEHRGRSCGYNIIGFDLPYLLRRSFALGIQPSIIPDLRRYQTHPTLDLMMVLYNWQNFKGLKFVAERYGILNPLPELDGSMVADMDYETLHAYVRNDVLMTYYLYKKMKGIYFA